MGKHFLDFDPLRTHSYVAPTVCSAKFRQNRIRIATVRVRTEMVIYDVHVANVDGISRWTSHISNNIGPQRVVYEATCVLPLINQHTVSASKLDSWRQ